MATTGNTNIFKKIFKGITVFSAIFGACATIWFISAYFTKKDNSAVIVSNKVELIITNQLEDRIIRDTILLKLNGLAVLQDDIIKLKISQENLTNAMSEFISNNKLATKQDLQNFLDELKKKQINKIDTTINKIDTTKNNFKIGVKKTKN